MRPINAPLAAAAATCIGAELWVTATTAETAKTIIRINSCRFFHTSLARAASSPANCFLQPIRPGAASVRRYVQDAT
jgi:hypothetical protein